MQKFCAAWIMMMVCLSASAQYYYDRSKNPDKKNNVVQKAERDFDTFYFLSWDNNAPLTNKDFISQTSWLGTKLGFRKRLNSEDRLWAGAELGWAVYREYFPYSTYQTSSTQSLSTDLYNYSYNYSLGASLDYFILPMQHIVAPYAGFTIGAAYDKYAQYYNVYGSTSNSWGLLLRPEVGALIGFKQNSSWRVKVAYHYDFSTNTNKDFGYKNFSSTGFQIGVVKMAW